MTSSCSDHSRIGPALSMTFHLISFQCWSAIILCGRRSIWCGLRVLPVAPRIVNDCSYIGRIHRASHFSWQAQHLVMSERHYFRGRCSIWCCWSVTFGDVAVSLFLAGAAFADVAAFRGSCSGAFRGRRSIW